MLEEKIPDAKCPKCQGEDIMVNVCFEEDICYGNQCSDCFYAWDFA